MSLQLQVLGEPGRDNALLVRVNTGQSIHRLLFDCGEDCVSTLPLAEIQSIDHLFFSHLHMDHVAGFDSFFRTNFNRITKPNVIWGPPGTAEVMHHRFQGFWWNLHEGQPGVWEVRDIEDSGEVKPCRFEVSDAFRACFPGESLSPSGTVLQHPDFTVSAFPLEHHGRSLAYLIREAPRLNVDPEQLQALGLRPGPWMKTVKEGAPEPRTVEVEGQTYSLEELRSRLLVESPGDSAAYLTDFLIDEATTQKLVPWLQNCGTLICEAQYRHDDLALARRHHHATTTQVAELAKRAGCRRLILFHLSSRYQEKEWTEMLEEARALFPNTAFPPNWRLR